MTNKVDILDAVIVGAGWAGLGVSHALKQRSFSHQVLERGRVGETWRTQRWDTFRMNTPNVQTIMPGDSYSGADPEGALTREAFVALLEEYAERNRLPVQRNCLVTELAAGPEDGVYQLTTSRGVVAARNVVVASGSLNVPRRPPWASALPQALHQLDASEYRGPSHLPEGAVLVVGSGQSGCQIAEDLAEAGRTVFLSTSRTGRLPRRYRGRDIMIWLTQTGFLDVRREQIMQMAGRIPARGVVGSTRTISLQYLSSKGIVLLGRMTGSEKGGSLTFDDSAEDHLRFADEASESVRRHIDEFIENAGVNAPAAEPDPAEIVVPTLPNPPILALDPVASAISTVIWCVGFRGDFGWVRLPGVLDAEGQPLQEDGVTALPGIYFAGVEFGSTRKSGIILAISEEAPRLAEHIAGRPMGAGRARPPVDRRS